MSAFPCGIPSGSPDEDMLSGKGCVCARDGVFISDALAVCEAIFYYRNPLRLDRQVHGLFWASARCDCWANARERDGQKP